MRYTCIMTNMEIFSERERDVIKLLLQGKSNKQIALALGVSQSTVEYHLKNVYRKLQVSSRTEAVLRLGKSIGDSATSELGKSTVEVDDKPADNGGKSISTRRLSMNKMYVIIGGSLLTTALVIVFVLAKMSAQNTGVLATIQTSATSIIQLSTETPLPPTPTATLDVNTTPSSSISNEMFLIINQRDYYISTLDGSDSTLLFSGKDSPIEMASLSPDKTLFAYFKDNFIYIQDIETQKTTKLNKEIIGSFGGNLRWLPDGKKLFMSCANAQQPSMAVCTIDTSNGQVEVLINEKNTDEVCHTGINSLIIFQDLSNDGTKIVYSCIIPTEQGYRAPFAIYIYDILSKTSVKVLGSESQTIVWGQPSALISPDGNSLLINSGNPNHLINIYLLDLRTRAIAQLTNDSAFSFQATTWENDSQNFYLHQTLVSAPYAEKNSLMNVKGEIISPIVDIQGIINR